jgi:aminocarboxymuconate-semialdehyde decarboxylase
MKIDVHNHAVPESVVAFLEREPAFGITVTGERQLSGGPEGEYTLQDRFSDADTKVADLEAHGLDAAVISIDPPFFYYDVDADAGAALAELLNQGLKEMCAQRPDRLAWMATIPLQDPVRAAEMLTAQHAAGCVGVELGTSTGARRLDDPVFEPVWDAAEGLGLPVMLHPAYQHPHPGFDRFHLTNVIGNMLETTIAIERLILAGVLDRHPGLNFVIVHSGGYFAYQQGRLRHARTVRSYADDVPRDPAKYFGQVALDCLTHDRDALGFLLTKAGVDNVVLGTDLPCDMATPEPWTELVAVAGEEVAHKVAEENVARRFDVSALQGVTMEGAST